MMYLYYELGYILIELTLKSDFYRTICKNVNIHNIGNYLFIVKTKMYFIFSSHFVVHFKN